jgi:uncharacterized protein YndB with AHSA1/START domain
METAMTTADANSTDRDLVLTRIIDAPREKVYRCWTDPELVKQWFAPRPWSTSEVRMDVRAGGSSYVVMRDPDGNDYPNPGLFLEVVPNEKLVFTDAFTSAWQPSEKPFMVVILTFEDEGGKTKYTAIARHWTAADREAHEKMGFHEGWGQCASQLEELAKSL